MSYSKTVIGDILLLNIEADIDASVANQISKETFADVEANPSLKNVVLDLKNKYLVKEASMRIFSPMGLELRKENRVIHILNSPKAVRGFISQMGMSLILRNLDSLELLKTGGPSSLDVKFINPFIDGAINVLKVQCSTECKPQKPVLKEHLKDNMNIDIAGIIGITSKSFSGSIALCFPGAVFLSLMSSMLGEDYKEITQELEDGAGELLNIIFGHAKKVLNEGGYTLEKAIPTVVSGKNIGLKHLTLANTIVLPFETPAGLFFIEIGTERAAAEEKAA